MICQPLLNLLASPIFFFTDTATTEIYTLSLHDALPISRWMLLWKSRGIVPCPMDVSQGASPSPKMKLTATLSPRSEEHTSELQSRQYLVCRLLLEKKKNKIQQKI